MFSKKVCQLWIVALLITAVAFAGSVKLAWDPNTEPELVGYKLYYGTASGNYTNMVDVGNATVYEVSGLAPNTYYFAVTAYSADVQSAYSNEVSATILSIVPPDFNLIGISAIDKTTATIIWTTLHECDGTAFWSTDKTRWLSKKSNNLGTTDHLVSLTGLTARTHYYYKVQSVCDGNLLESTIRSFNTK